MTYDGSDSTMYMNGVGTAGSSFGGAINDGATAVGIGAWPGTAPGQGSFFEGTIDEARISSSARSADWVKACYDNQSGGSFVGYSPVETSVEPSPGGLMLIVK